MIGILIGIVAVAGLCVASYVFGVWEGGRVVRGLIDRLANRAS